MNTKGKLKALACLALAVCALPALAQQCEPGLRGATINWAGVACKIRVETDDFWNEDVQACLRTELRKYGLRGAPREVCRLNRVYKAEMCLIGGHRIGEAAFAACLRSPRTIPLSVSEGE
jgi:hypothetical protein